MQLSDNKETDINRKQMEQLLGGGLDRLPHALLLVGAEGLGKAAFAENVARRLLCESPRSSGGACGECQACHWIAGGNHPDFRHVKPESDEDAEEGARERSKKRGPGLIRIDQIRELESFVFVGSHRMGRRVVLLTEAEAMNGPAANSLLKILEEPPPSVYFILVSSRSKALLPTIRSRCRTLAFPTPERGTAAALLAQAGLGKQAGRYLDLAAGAPMRVAQWNEGGLIAPLDALIETLQNPPADPISLATRWDALLKSEPVFHMEHLVEEVQRWFFDLALERLAGSIRYHGGWSRPKPVSGGLNQNALLAGWRELMQFRRSARHPLNQLLFLEGLASHYLRALRPVSA